MARRWMALLLVLVGLQLAGAPVASAHSVLISSTPAEGQVLARAPRTIELRFSEAVDPRATRIGLVDGAGRHWQPESVRLSGEATIVATLPPLGRQSYRIIWRTVASDDRHETSGVVVFGVGTASAARPLPADPVPAWREVLLWWVLLVSVGGVVGGLLADALGARRVRGTPAALAFRRLVLSVAVASGTVAALAAAALYLVHGGGAGVFGSAYGLRSVAREGGIVLLVVVAWHARRRASTRSSRAREALAAAGLGTVATATALLGHTATSPARALLGAVHLAAAVTWFGTLWVVAAAAAACVRSSARVRRLRGTVVEVLVPFGGIAAASVAALVVTGVLLTGDSARTVDSLFTSVFGRLLAAKIALAVVAGLLGWRTHRTLRHARPRVSPRALLAESAVLAAVLLAAAALSSAAPPQGLRFAPGVTVAGSQTVSGEVDGIVEAVTVSPDRPGHNFVTVDAYNSRRPAPAAIDSVTVRLIGPGGEVVDLPATPDVAGRWVAATDGVQQSGAWTISLAVGRGGLPTASATYPWRVAGSVGGPARRIVSTAPVAPLAGLIAVAILVGLALVVALRAGRRRPVDSRDVDSRDVDPRPAGSRDAGSCGARSYDAGARLSAGSPRTTPALRG